MTLTPAQTILEFCTQWEEIRHHQGNHPTHQHNEFEREDFLKKMRNLDKARRTLPRGIWKHLANTSWKAAYAYHYQDAPWERHEHAEVAVEETKHYYRFFCLRSLQIRKKYRPPNGGYNWAFLSPTAQSIRAELRAYAATIA